MYREDQRTELKVKLTKDIKKKLSVNLTLNSFLTSSITSIISLPPLNTFYQIKEIPQYLCRQCVLINIFPIIF